jgi:predicted lysophospholipase L1 biosynthesis ABC-type transport system permease subunit
MYTPMTWKICLGVLVISALAWLPLESFARGLGIAQVNQAAGNMNSQFNSTSVNLMASGAILLTDAELCAPKTRNTIHDNPSSNTHCTKLDTKDPVSNFTALRPSSQTAGNMDHVKTIYTIHGITVPYAGPKATWVFYERGNYEEE